MDFIKKAELIKQMETTKKRELRSVLDLAASAALLVVLNRLFGCPIRLVTGVSCAGCGMTRALHALAHGEVLRAFSMNPLAISLLAA